MLSFERYDIIRYIIAFILSLYLSINGYRKNSLSLNGSMAAFSVGLITFCASYKYGIILILFYLTSTKLTKYGKNIKMKLENDYNISSNRNAIQVYSNSILATIISIFYLTLIIKEQKIEFNNNIFNNFSYSKSLYDNLIELQNFILPELYVMNKNFHLIYKSENIIKQQYFCSLLNCLFIAHYACATADTWASELGILSTQRPKLISSLCMKTVPHGTNGGITLLGVLVSGLGGLFIGFIFILLKNEYYTDGLYIIFTKNDLIENIKILLYSFICGLFGSLIDSLLGATLQQTLYSKNKKCVVKNILDYDNSIVIICGYDILSNEAVNFISILLTMILGIIIAPIIFQNNDLN